MRKLLFILILFIVAIIGIILLYNTVLNTPRQLQPTTQPELQQVDISEIAQQALKLPTPTTATAKEWGAYQQFVKKSFETLFETKSMVWQQFEKYSLVGKWTGKNTNLPPLILIASPSTFFQMQDSVKILNHQSKITSISLLASMEKMMKNGIEPDRTTYIILPHTAVAEEQIIGALSLSKVKPYMILKSGGAIVAKDFWGVARPIGFIGVGNKNQYKGQWLVNDTMLKTEHIIQALQEKKVDVLTSDSVVKILINNIGPETSFGQKVLWSNGWLLSRWQHKQLTTDITVQQLLGQQVQYSLVNKDSNNLIELQWTAESGLRKAPFNPLHQYKELDLIDSTLERTHKGAFISSTTSPTYRMISSSFKEVYKGALTAPCRVQDSFFEYYAALTPNIYYFTPLESTPTWNEKTIQQLGQFHYRLLESTLKE